MNTRSLWLVLVALSAIAFLACAKPAAAAAAKVVVAEGAVQIQSARGKLRPAKSKDDLAATDLLIVPARGMLVVQLLANGYLVRVDEELELKVEELALYGAPRASTEPIAQLNALLSKEERDRVNERMTGFYASVSAADTQGAKSHADLGKSNESLQNKTIKNLPLPRPAPAPEPEAAPDAKPATPPPAARPTAQALTPGEPPQRKRPEIEAQQGTSPQAGGPMEADSVQEEGGAMKERKDDSAPQTWPSPEQLEALKSCLAPEVARLGVGPKVGRLLSVRYRSTGATRLSLEGALPVPACALSWLNQASPPDTAGAWKQFELGL